VLDKPLKGASDSGSHRPHLDERRLRFPGRTPRSMSSPTGSTTAPGCSTGMRCYETEAWAGGVPQRKPHRAPAALRAAVLHAGALLGRGNCARRRSSWWRANGLRSCYIRPIVNRGYGQMGLNPLEAPVDVTIACWEWGSYLGEEGKRNGVPRQGVPRGGASAPDSLDSPGEGLRAVSEQRARQGRVPEGRLRRGDPARPSRQRVRGHGRECVHRARRRDHHARPAQLDPRWASPGAR